MGYALRAKIVIPLQLCRNKVFEKYFPEWGIDMNLGCHENVYGRLRITDIPKV